MFEKIFKDKAQMSGIQMMLKGLGFNIESLIPQAEKALLDWFKGMEAKAGCSLAALATRSGDQFLISMYKVAENGSLQRYGETFALQDFKNFINNLENLKDEPNAENRPVAGIAAPTAAAGATTNNDLSKGERGIPAVDPASE